MSAPARPPHITERAWQRMPLAKRHLAVVGPIQPGTLGAFYGALTLAAELRLHGVTEEEAIVAVLAMPYAGGSKPPSQMRRQFRNAVQIAYHPKAGGKLLSGCCRDPRPRSGSAASQAMRDSFSGHCGDECARTCPMLRQIRQPDRCLYGTPHEPLDTSSLWMHGGKLGTAGREIWRLLANLSLAQGSDEVHATGSYLALKLDGQYAVRHVRRVLAELDRLGIVTKENRKSKLRRVHVLTPEEIAALERQRPVSGKRQANLAEARKEADDHLAYISTAVADWTFGDDE